MRKDNECWERKQRRCKDRNGGNLPVGSCDKVGERKLCLIPFSCKTVRECSASANATTNRTVSFEWIPIIIMIFYEPLNIHYKFHNAAISASLCFNCSICTWHCILWKYIIFFFFFFFLLSLSVGLRRNQPLPVVAHLFCTPRQLNSWMLQVCWAGFISWARQLLVSWAWVVNQLG